MKRLPGFFIAFISLALLPGIAVLAGCSPRNVEHAPHVASIEALVREGDVVFRRGGGLTSRAVLMADEKGVYSHVGIVVRTGKNVGGGIGGREDTGDGSAWQVVHMVPGERGPDGKKDVIKTESLERFFAPDRALRGAVMRVDALETAARASRRAAGLARTEMAFDHDYDLDDTTRMYCTELIYHVYTREGLDLTEGRRSVINLPGFRGGYILPTDLQHSSHTRIIFEY